MNLKDRSHWKKMGCKKHVHFECDKYRISIHRDYGRITYVSWAPKRVYEMRESIGYHSDPIEARVACFDHKESMKK